MKASSTFITAVLLMALTSLVATSRVYAATDAAVQTVSFTVGSRMKMAVATAQSLTFFQGESEEATPLPLISRLRTNLNERFFTPVFTQIPCWAFNGEDGDFEDSDEGVFVQVVVDP